MSYNESEEVPVDSDDLSLPGLMDRYDEPSDNDDDLPRLRDRYEDQSDDDEYSASSGTDDDDDDDDMNDGTTLKCPICSVLHEKDTPFASSYQQCSHGAILIYIPADCPVCLREKIDPPNVALPCGHVYCMEDFKLMKGCVGIGNEIQAGGTEESAATTERMTVEEEGDVDNYSMPRLIERIREAGQIQGRDSEDEGDGSEVGDDLQPGSLMVLDSLRRTPRLNGEVVSIIEPTGSGRYIVRLTSRGVDVSVNATNLVPRLPVPNDSSDDDDDSSNDSFLPALVDNGRYDSSRSDEDDSRVRMQETENLILLQSVWRSRMAREGFNVQRKLKNFSSTKIQATWRGFAVRLTIRRNAAAIKIHAISRGHIARIRYKKKSAFVTTTYGNNSSSSWCRFANNHNCR